MSQTTTDVSTAQSFDVSSFLNNLVNAGAAVATAAVAPSQNTGQPSATTVPILRAQPGGNSAPAAGGALAGISPSLIVAGVIGVAALIYVLRK